MLILNVTLSRNYGLRMNGVQGIRNFKNYNKILNFVRFLGCYDYSSMHHQIREKQWHKESFGEISNTRNAAQ